MSQTVDTGHAASICVTCFHHVSSTASDNVRSQCGCILRVEQGSTYKRCLETYGKPSSGYIKLSLTCLTPMKCPNGDIFILQKKFQYKGLNVCHGKFLFLI